MGAIIAASARFAIPLIALFALSLLAREAPGDGVGFRAGLVLALIIAIHSLVFGAQAARRAFPLPLARLLLGLGVSAALLGAGAPGLPMSAQLMEGGLCAATASGAAIVLSVLVGRAPTLRDAL